MEVASETYKMSVMQDECILEINIVPIDNNTASDTLKSVTSVDLIQSLFTVINITKW